MVRAAESHPTIRSDRTSLASVFLQDVLMIFGFDIDIGWNNSDDGGGGRRKRRIMPSGGGGGLPLKVAEIVQDKIGDGDAVTLRVTAHEIEFFLRKPDGEPCIVHTILRGLCIQITTGV